MLPPTPNCHSYIHYVGMYKFVWMIVNGHGTEWNETLCHEYSVPHGESRILKQKEFVCFTIDKYYILLFSTNIDRVYCWVIEIWLWWSKLIEVSVKTKNERTWWKNIGRMKYRSKMNNCLLRGKRKWLFVTWTDLGKIW